MPSCTQLLDLVNGWVNYGSGYGNAKVSKIDGMVQLSGFVNSGDWGGKIAVLPAGLRPSHRLIFDVSCHENSIRVDVMPNGDVVYVAGAHAQHWISLDGISFTLESHGDHRPLDLFNRWANYGGEYGNAKVSKIEGMVQLSGLVKNGAWGGKIAVLPAGLRPSQRLIFDVSCHQNSIRVDVLPNGDVVYVAGAHAHHWISLDGISFTLESHGDHRPLDLFNGWANYGGGYGNAKVSKIEGMVQLSGLVKSGAWGRIAVLPAGLRPSQRLVFDVNCHENSIRVDVLPNGDVVYVTGDHRTANWISLDGINFECIPSVVGEQGPPGPQRNVGQQGAQGPQGPQGQRGDPGPPGAVGPAGEEGRAGMPGDRGPQGPPGPPGQRGEQGPSGAVGPSGQKGDQGVSGLQGIAGEQGPRGEQGPPGLAGPKGDRGDPGERGEAGPRGDRGDRGEAGPRGDRGDRGEVGPAGPQGERGQPGPPGQVDDSRLALLEKEVKSLQRMLHDVKQRQADVPDRSTSETARDSDCSLGSFCFVEETCSDDVGDCFLRNALFERSNGDLSRADKLRVGDQICAEDGSVLKISRHKLHPVKKRLLVELYAVDTAPLVITEEHRIRIPGGEKLAGRLEPGSQVICNSGATKELVQVNKKMHEIDVVEIVFDPDKPVAVRTLFEQCILSLGQRQQRCRRGGSGRDRRADVDHETKTNDGFSD